MVRVPRLLLITIAGAGAAWLTLVLLVPRAPDSQPSLVDVDALERTLDSDSLALGAALDRGGASVVAPPRIDPGLSDPVGSAPRREELRGQVETCRRAFDLAATDEERRQALSKFTAPHQLYVRYGGGLENLEFLRRVVSTDSSPQVRQLAVIACHSLSAAEVVDVLIEWLASPHEEVRFYAAEGLAWVRGSEFRRAHAAMVGMLGDSDVDVRQITALSLGLVTKRAEDVPALLRRLEVESDPSVISAIDRSVVALDPARGQARLADARRLRPAQRTEPK